MKYVKGAGVIWGLIYFIFGALRSFTLNKVDFWVSVVLLFSLFLLPLPIAMIAVWSPKIAGASLLFCAVVSILADEIAMAAHASASISEKETSIATLALYIAPHLIFATIYILAARKSALRT